MFLQLRSCPGADRGCMWAAHCPCSRRGRNMRTSWCPGVFLVLWLMGSVLIQTTGVLLLIYLVTCFSHLCASCWWFCLGTVSLLLKCWPMWLSATGLRGLRDEARVLVGLFQVHAVLHEVNFHNSPILDEVFLDWHTCKTRLCIGELMKILWPEALKNRILHLL